jgi:hypothetical protein
MGNLWGIFTDVTAFGKGPPEEMLYLASSGCTWRQILYGRVGTRFRPKYYLLPGNGWDPCSKKNPTNEEFQGPCC